MKPDLSWSATDERKGIHKGLLWIAISTAVILAIMTTTAWHFSDKNISLWSETDWWKLGLGWILMCSALWALGHRWRVLLPTKNGPTGSELGAALCGALLLNYAVPGPFGEIVAAHHIHRRYRIPFATTLASGSVARLAGLFIAAVGALGLSAFSGIALSAEHRWALWICLGGIGVGALALTLLFLSPAKWVLRTTSAKAASAPSKIRNFFSDLADAVIACSARTAIQKAFGWSIIGHVLAGSGLALSVHALFGIGHWEALFLTYLVGTCLGSIAFLFPGSQFVWDGLIAGLLKSTAGLSGVQAVAAALTLRIEQLWMMGLGALSLKWLGSGNTNSERGLE